MAEVVVVRQDNTITVVQRSTGFAVIDRPAVTVVGSNATGPQGPQGAIGPQGPQGVAGVYVSDTPPDNTDLVWVDTTGL